MYPILCRRNTKYNNKEYNKSKFVSILADETQDISTRAQLSICIRFVEENLKAFLGFVELSRTDALTIKNSGQVNDGCSTMS